MEDYFALILQQQRAKTLGLAERPPGPALNGQVNIVTFARPSSSRSHKSARPNHIRVAPHTSNVDAARVDKAFRHLEFHVHCDLFETPAARHADILLPACSFAERETLRIGFDISEEAVEHVQLRPRMVKPRGESRADYDIVMDLAIRLGMGDQFFGGSIEEGWNYILAPLGLNTAVLRQQPGGIRKPIDQKERKYALLGAEGKPLGFVTETSRVELYSEQLHRSGYSAVPTSISDSNQKSVGEFPYLLTSAKNGYYCHSQHRNLASLRKRAPYPVVELSSELAGEKGIIEGDWVRIVTASGSARLRAKLAKEMASDVIVAEFGWWQACDEIGMEAAPVQGKLSSNFSNLVTGDYLDPSAGPLLYGRLVQYRT